MVKPSSILPIVVPRQQGGAPLAAILKLLRKTVKKNITISVGPSMETTSTISKSIQVLKRTSSSSMHILSRPIKKLMTSDIDKPIVKGNLVKKEKIKLSL